MKINFRAEFAKGADYCDLGIIPNPEEFSNYKGPIAIQRPFQRADNYDFSAIPPAFLPSIWKAINHQRKIKDLGFTLQLRQGELNDTNFFGSEPHTDAVCSDQIYGDNVVPSAIYLVSNILQPRIYTQKFVPPSGYIGDVEYNAVISRVVREQFDGASTFTPAPCHMVRFGPFTVHAGQKIVESTERALLTLRFWEGPIPELRVF